MQNGKVQINGRRACSKKISNNVYITVECRLGDRVMAIAHTVDGKWRSELLNIYPDAKVIAWFPAPELYKGECET